MSASLQRLLPLFKRERARHQPLVLATVVRTAGSTYTKPGAYMLIAGNGEYAGLLSGGCLEGDLAEHGRAVLATGIAKLVRYDTWGPDDLLFGLGSGCEGAMDILLQRLDSSNDWQPLKRLAQAWSAQRAQTLVLVVQSTLPNVPAGAGVFAGDHQVFGLSTVAATDPRTIESLCRLAPPPPHQGHNQFLPQALPGVDLLALEQLPPTRLLLLGAGPDAQPVAELAAFLGWNVTVIDHRSQYAQADRFPSAAAVLDGGLRALAALLLNEPADLIPEPQPPHFAAAIVMSHHLATDRAYLQALASSNIPYVGLLGPVTRRERLLADLGEVAEALRPRLRAPVGLDLGAVTPEAIALSIIAEIHVALAGRTRNEPLAQAHA
jgi:xanthine/CO dehydrogenase XdhC/CoxF family maturation factor